ncbi:MAG TPA: undecaprenyl-diphosphate phosphatase, partial [Candidatus Norongarragalinales archaeon]|nr:undecaprenyl-diphosphate phosphatase [Candidatus Norongarragalinales archaeon]
MDLFQASVLAIIQGISAWIPVSSKTQVILAANAFFGISFQTAVAYALALHAGDLLAAVYKYRKDYTEAVRQLLSPNKLTQFPPNDARTDGRFLVLSVLTTSVVALPAYLLLRKQFSEFSGETLLLVIGFLLLAMAGITVFSGKRPGEKPLDLKTTLFVGAAQGLAVIPGISRSGITQSALLLQGVPQERAMRLSFLMSAPMIAAALVAFFLVEGVGSLSW